MRKLSEYFKPADATQPPNIPTRRSMQMLGDREDSPLSDYISCPSPTPPPPRKNLDIRGGAKTAEVTEHTSELTTTQGGIPASSSSIGGGVLVARQIKGGQELSYRTQRARELMTR